ncbi:MAG: hypothetical protein DWQ40_04070 [Actinobacteria bacterium]|nr:MAG: hypothetical protein DWQ40_04070 [Actinomycetota bacterium]
MADACSVDGCQRPIYGRQEWCEMHYRRVLRTGKTGPPGPVTRAQGCIVDGCDASHDARGYCHGHYQRLQRTGDAGTTPLREGERMCSVEGCERPHKARGFCAAHYKRVLASGDPRPDEPIRAVKGIHEHKGYRFVPVPDRYRHLRTIRR